MQFVRRTFIRRGALALVAAPILASSAVTLTGCDASWIQTAINDLPAAISIAESIAGIVTVATGNGAIDAAVSASIVPITDAIKVGLITLQDAVQAYQKSASTSTLAKIDDTLTQLSIDLPNLLSTLTFTDQATKVAITTGISLLIATISALQMLVPPSAKSLQLKPARSTAPAMMKTKVELPQKGAVVTMFNSVLVSNGFAQLQVN